MNPQRNHEINYDYNSRSASQLKLQKSLDEDQIDQQLKKINLRLERDKNEIEKLKKAKSDLLFKEKYQTFEKELEQRKLQEERNRLLMESQNQNLNNEVNLHKSYLANSRDGDFFYREKSKNVIFI